ncbi:MAG: malto-oligosyltrehalose trehalohydrolase [Terriglobales bacterium]
MKRNHPMPFGAEFQVGGSVRFRLWAPAAKNVKVCVENKPLLPMAKDDKGWFEVVSAAVKAGDLYQFQINDDLKVPDPASRFQPKDVHGPSQIINPALFDWKDENWLGRPWEEVVLYELHVGTFSPEGTFAGVEARLEYLVDLGITAVELMPVSDFPGKRNWGYDGVLPFAPDSSYGRPEDLKHLLAAAHAKGLMIFLDVVYNHFGPDGNYLSAYSPQFFTDRHSTPWGPGINFDSENSRVIRDFFIHNALYWLEEYNFDGLRLDAVHAILDDSKTHILTELAETVRERFGEERHIHLVLENGANLARYLVPADDRKPKFYNAQWNDDLHHAFHVLLTRETDGYYSDYAKNPLEDLGRCLAEGFAYQGEISVYEGNIPRGEPSRELPPSAFVSFLQNHDQIGNRAFGDRIGELATPEALRAATAILLLAPSVPLLFMGDEFAAKAPFQFFCDFEGKLADQVREGRRSEFARFAKFSSPETRANIPDPNSEVIFQRSKLDWGSLKQHSHLQWLEFYRELLALRREEIIPRLRGSEGNSAALTTQGKGSLMVEWKLSKGSKLMLFANLVGKSEEAAGRLQSNSARLIYTNGPSSAASLKRGEEKVTLPPWFVAWFVNP